MHHPSAVPLVTRVDASTGALVGRTGRYEKRLRDLGGVYADQDAFSARLAVDPDELIYVVEEHRPSEQPGDLIHGTSTLYPGTIGDEYHMTRGHLHAIADRAETYHCLSGHGLLLCEELDGTTSIAELHPGEIAYVGPHRIHRSVNVGDEPFTTLFTYAADAGQDYEIIATAGGMAKLIARADDAASRWVSVDNEAYRGR